jgi:hypothetical protein
MNTTKVPLTAAAQERCLHIASMLRSLPTFGEHEADRPVVERLERMAFIEVEYRVAVVIHSLFDEGVLL